MCQREASGALHPLGERNQRGRVSLWARGLRQNNFVASHLTFKRQAIFNPPHCRMKEEQRFEDLLG
jgi:hypothetical protein